MRQTPIFKAKGLYTYYNEISEVPEGALIKAENVNIDADGVITPRRGQMELASYGDPERPLSMFNYQDQVLSHFTDGKIGYYDEGTFNFVTYTQSFQAMDEYIRLKTEKAQNSLFVASKTGVYKLDNLANEFRLSGIPTGLELTASLNVATDFLPNNKTVAYRLLFGLKDSNNNISYGTPSQRVEISNTSGGTRSVTIVSTLPSDITADYFYQLYRTDIFDVGVVPNDEMQLVYEKEVTSTDVANKYITITDITPDLLKGEFLYTSSSQEGLIYSNSRPPIARDLALFKDHLFYANITGQHRLFLTLIAVGGSAGIQLDDILTIGGITYTAKAAESVVNREFKLDTSGTPSQNIANTALSLIKIVNQATTSTVYGYYVSSFSDLPGKILFEERGIGGSAFSIICSAHGTAFNPSLPTVGTTVSSTNDSNKHYIAFSKYQQPEAVPFVQSIPVGSSVFGIDRILPLRDSLIILKKDGVFRLVGTDKTSFSIIPLDTTAPVISADSAVVLNNSVVALTSQGVARITDTSVEVISRPIEDYFQRLIGSNLDGLKKSTFAISYESDRKYILFLPNTSGLAIHRALVYNVFTNAWTTWEISRNCGVVSTTANLLYCGSSSDSKIYKERKSNSVFDYIDREIPVNILSQTDNFLFMDSVSNIEIGDVIIQATIGGSNIYGVVIDKILASNIVQIASPVTFVIGVANIGKAFQSNITYNSFFGGNPHITKHFAEIMLVFKKAFFPTAYSTFSTNFLSTFVEVDFNGQTGTGWGTFEWGSAPWGGSLFNISQRIWVPLEKQRGNSLQVGFRIKSAYGSFELEGYSLIYQDGNQTGSK